MADYISQYTGGQIDSAVGRALPGGTLEALIADIAVESTVFPGCFYRTVNGVVEWINPPMQFGEEYLTTERYLGKPVYVKMIDFGALPNATVKQVAHGISNIGYPISAYGSLQSGWSTFPVIGIDSQAGIIADCSFTNTYVRVWCSVDYTVNAAYIVLKYTKTTD